MHEDVIHLLQNSNIFGNEFYTFKSFKLLERIKQFIGIHLSVKVFTK